MMIGLLKGYGRSRTTISLLKRLWLISHYDWPSQKAMGDLARQMAFSKGYE